MSSSTQRVRAHVAACMLLGAGMIGDAHAAIVYSGAVSIPIPATLDGVYINLVTGVTGPSAASVPGYDANPYSSGGVPATFHLFANATPPTNGYLSLGGTNQGPYRLPEGTPIGAVGATFFRPVGAYNAAPELNLNSSDNLIGVSFLNEALGVVNFGWFRVQVGATTATRTIVGYAYETGGTPIAAGATGVVPNAPPTITSTAVSVTEGSPSDIVPIATVGDAEDAAPPTVTVNGGASATVNGVTVSGLTTDPVSEQVTASVVAACGATSAGFTLRATDSGSAFAEVALQVSVTPNTPPEIGYPTTNALIGGSASALPVIGPDDNGSIASIVLLSAGTYTGSVAVDNGNGVVGFDNAQPVGDHALQIRITDNCGAATDASLPLVVSAAVDLAIAKTVDTSGLGDGVVAYTIVVTNAGPSTATGASVTDVFASPQTGVEWTCSTTGGGSCTAGGSGDINDLATVPPGAVVTYTAVADVPVPLTVSFENSAIVAPPSGAVDTDPSNDSSTVFVQRIDIFADGFESPPPP